jgi:uncharacterized protein YjaZ
MPLASTKNNTLVTISPESRVFSGFCLYWTIEREVNKVKFKVNGLNWTVQSVQRENEKLKVKDNACFGVTYYQDLQIFLDETMAKELYRQTVIHELIHAFAFSFGVHLVANEKTEESVCDFMGAHLDEIYSAANKIMDSCYGKGGESE